MVRKPVRGWRHRCYELLERGSVGDWGSRVVDGVIILVVIVSLIAIALESIPAIAREYHAAFAALELAALIVFSVEYALRLWVAVEHPLYRHMPARLARLKYAVNMPGIIDLIAVLPFWLEWLLPT